MLQPVLKMPYKLVSAREKQMIQKPAPTPQNHRDALIQTYAINDAINQLILSRLDPRAWRAEPPGKKGNGRTIAAMFAHLHNSRLVWIRNSAPHLKCPAPLNPDR